MLRLWMCAWTCSWTWFLTEHTMHTTAPPPPYFPRIASASHPEVSCGNVADKLAHVTTWVRKATGVCNTVASCSPRAIYAWPGLACSCGLFRLAAGLPSWNSNTQSQSSVANAPSHIDNTVAVASAVLRLRCKASFCHLQAVGRSYRPHCIWCVLFPPFRARWSPCCCQAFPDAGGWGLLVRGVAPMSCIFQFFLAVPLPGLCANFRSRRCKCKVIGTWFVGLRAWTPLGCKSPG